MKYQSKPQIVEAIQWTGNNYPEVEAFCSTDKCELTVDGLMIIAGLKGAQGFVKVPQGHFVLRNPGSMDDLWPVDATAFWRKYDPMVSLSVNGVRTEVLT